jgi:hypothetical protein
MTEQGTPRHDELPLPDYDHLPTGSLEGRIRSLDAPALEQLVAYERAHGNRLPVVQLLERRLEAVAGGAALSGGAPDAPTPETHSSQSGGKVGPHSGAPPVNPPSQGVPTNPAQPRK